VEVEAAPPGLVREVKRGGTKAQPVELVIVREREREFPHPARRLSTQDEETVPSRQGAGASVNLKI